MNKVILMGRLVRDAEMRYIDDDKTTIIALFSLAVDRRRSRNATGQTADFINCLAFGKRAEFFEKFGTKGTKFVIDGQIRSSSYKNKDGQKIYTTSVLVENVEFAESKSTTPKKSNSQAAENDFMNIPDSICDAFSNQFNSL